MSVFGARMRRKEDGRLITGRGRYLSDVELPRMLHVAFVRSVHAHARIVTVDATAAMAVPGVVTVATGADADIAPHRIRAKSALPSYVETEQPVLVGAEARFAGEALAAVVATDATRPRMPPPWWPWSTSRGPRRWTWSRRAAVLRSCTPASSQCPPVATVREGRGREIADQLRRCPTRRSP